MLSDVRPDDDLFTHLARTGGDGDGARYRRLLGAANEFKEGDAALGLAAADMSERTAARALLAGTRVGDLAARPPFRDDLHDRLQAALDPHVAAHLAPWSLARLKQHLLTADPSEVHPLLPGLASDVSPSLTSARSLGSTGRSSRPTPPKSATWSGR